MAEKMSLRGKKLTRQTNPKTDPQPDISPPDDAHLEKQNQASRRDQRNAPVDVAQTARMLLKFLTDLNTNIKNKKKGLSKPDKKVSLDEKDKEVAVQPNNSKELKALAKSQNAPPKAEPSKKKLKTITESVPPPSTQPKTSQPAVPPASKLIETREKTPFENLQSREVMPNLNGAPKSTIMPNNFPQGMPTGTQPNKEFYNFEDMYKDQNLVKLLQAQTLSKQLPGQFPGRQQFPAGNRGMVGAPNMNNILQNLNMPPHILAQAGNYLASQLQLMHPSAHLDFNVYNRPNQIAPPIFNPMFMGNMTAGQQGLPPIMFQNMTKMAPNIRPQPPLQPVRMPHPKDTHGAVMTGERKIFKRAAFHIAIAYHIHLQKVKQKQKDRMDPNSMDPTYRARMLREQSSQQHESDDRQPTMRGERSDVNSNGSKGYNSNSNSENYPIHHNNYHHHNLVIHETPEAHQAHRNTNGSIENYATPTKSVVLKDNNPINDESQAKADGEQQQKTQAQKPDAVSQTPENKQKVVEIVEILDDEDELPPQDQPVQKPNNDKPLQQNPVQPQKLTIQNVQSVIQPEQNHTDVTIEALSDQGVLQKESPNSTNIEKAIQNDIPIAEQIRTAPEIRKEQQKQTAVLENVPENNQTGAKEQKNDGDLESGEIVE